MELAKGYHCTVYPGKNARPRHCEIKNIYKDDAEYFESINAETSMEPVGDLYALYADIGLKEPDDITPKEATIITRKGEACEDAFKRLRALCERMLT